MLFFYLFGAQEQQSEMEKIYAEPHPWMFSELLPGAFHFFGPVDIANTENTVVVSELQALLKIIDSWLETVIPVEVEEIDPVVIPDHTGKNFPKWPLEYPDLIELRFLKVLTGNGGNLRVTFYGDKSGIAVGGHLVKGGNAE